METYDDPTILNSYSCIFIQSKTLKRCLSCFKEDLLPILAALDLRMACSHMT